MLGSHGKKIAYRLTSHEVFGTESGTNFESLFIMKIEKQNGRLNPLASNNIFMIAHAGTICAY